MYDIGYSSLKIMSIYYFGYGKNKDPFLFEKILGVIPEGGDGALIQNYNLCYQSLDQIPNPPANILLDVWGKDFHAYTLTSGQGMVVGLIWTIEDTMLDRIKEWEFDGVWRKIIEVEVITYDNKKIKCFTDIALNNDKYIEIVDGLNYPTDLNEKKIVTDRELNQVNGEVTKKMDKLQEELGTLK
jgi:hypothetical protein